MIRDSKLIKRFASWYFDKKVLPYWAILLMDAAIVCVSSMFTYWVTNRTLVTVENRTALLLTSLLYGILSWVGARIFRTYLGVLRYSSTVDLAKLAYANLVAFGLAVASSLIFKQLGVEVLCALSPLETMVVFLISTLLMWALRLLVKTIYEAGCSDTKAMRVLIYGALTGGVGLAKYIRSQTPVRFELVGFISHEHRIKDKKLLGVPVYTVDDDIAAVVKRDKIEGVLVSPLRVDDFRQNQKIQNVLIEAGCKIFMAHDAHEASVKNGMIAYDDADGVQLREVSVEDLLPRQQIHVDMKSVGELLEGKRVLITGSAGSIGSEIVRQVAQFNPAKMMLIDQAETPQHDILLMMAKDYPNVDAEIVVTSISRRTRMEEVFSTFRPDYVFHAAALKQVPSCEFFPMEAVKTNVIGTDNTLDAAIDAGVKCVICLSTDKAAYPINAMGITKAIEEKIAVAKSRLSGDTKICCTRYGNVMCSRGSVIPLWIDQIRKGNPITLTEPKMTRFIMSLEEAVDLVLFAFEHGNNGDIMVQKAPACTIQTQAEAVCELFAEQSPAGSRFKVQGSSGSSEAAEELKRQIRVIGIRHGEKMYETLLTKEEAAKAIDMGNFYAVPADNRDLNYDKYFKDGDTNRATIEEFNSDNTRRLNLEETKAKIASLTYIQNELNGIPNLV